MSEWEADPAAAAWRHTIALLTQSPRADAEMDLEDDADAPESSIMADLLDELTDGQSRMVLLCMTNVASTWLEAAAAASGRSRSQLLSELALTIANRNGL